MPKIGQKADNRPYYHQCRDCGCKGLQRLVSRFKPDGTPAGRVYACTEWPRPHDCDTSEREGCNPERVYTDEPLHMHNDGYDGMWTHYGPAAECTVDLRRVGDILVDRPTRELIDMFANGAPVTHRALAGGADHMGPLERCKRPECEPPFDRGPWGDWPMAVPGPGESGDPWAPDPTDEDV